MAYTSDLLKDRVIILNRAEAVQNRFGLDAGGVNWEQTACVYASVDWAKGKTAMNAGALDVYGVVMVRMRWNDKITLRSRIIYDEKTYQILGDTFHADKRENTIQFHAQLVIND